MMSKKNEKINNNSQEEQSEQELEDQVSTIEAEDNAALIENLRMELSKTQAKADEYLDGWQRSRAEFNNYKKRIERD